VEAWKSLRRYNGRCQFFTWLCAILLNRYRNTCAKSARCPFPLLAAEDAASSKKRPRSRWPTMNRCPIKPPRCANKRRLVRRCIQALPPKHQQVIHAAVLCGRFAGGHRRRARLFGRHGEIATVPRLGKIARHARHERPRPATWNRRKSYFMNALSKETGKQLALAGDGCAWKVPASKQELRAHLENCAGCRRLLWRSLRVSRENCARPNRNRAVNRPHRSTAT
jgi:hypothetical protein